jgi:hypothetical protein
MADADLQLLRPLTGLTELGLSLLRQCSKEVVTGFRAVMPRLKTVFLWTDLGAYRR